MDATTANAFELIRQLHDQVALTGPQRRQIEAAVTHLEQTINAITPPAPDPTPADSVS